jgi:chromosome segregation ATPase
MSKLFNPPKGAMGMSTDKSPREPYTIIATPKSEYDALVNERDKLQQELAEVQEKLEHAKAQITDYENALSDMLPYLKTSTDMPDVVLAVMVSPAEQLRRAAADIELKDLRINRARETLYKWRKK